MGVDPQRGRYPENSLSRWQKRKREYTELQAEIFRKKLPLILFDLYWLRYEKPGDQWYELTDYLRDSLKKDGYLVKYDDKNKDILLGNISVKNDICPKYT